jgi:hypothetical protein
MNGKFIRQKLLEFYHMAPRSTRVIGFSFLGVTLVRFGEAGRNWGNGSQYGVAKRKSGAPVEGAPPGLLL